MCGISITYIYVWNKYYLLKDVEVCGSVRFLSIHGNYSALHWIIVSQKWHLGHRQMRSQCARFLACCQPDF